MDLRLPDVTDAWRVVHAEGDGLSGLVVDRYGSVAVASLFSLGWLRRFDELERVLKDELGVERVVARTDEKTAGMEGFRSTRPRGVPRVEVHERGTRYLVDPAGGHKTGFFLDQRDHRDLVARLAKGRHVFDGMTYTGGFALAAATRGAPASVVAMDLDEEALDVGRAEREAQRRGASSSGTGTCSTPCARSRRARRASARTCSSSTPRSGRATAPGLERRHREVPRPEPARAHRGGRRRPRPHVLVLGARVARRLRRRAARRRRSTCAPSCASITSAARRSTTRCRRRSPRGATSSACCSAPGRPGEGPGRSERPGDEDAPRYEGPDGR